MSIEVGKVAVVKTTGEKVFVLKSVPTDSEFVELGASYLVRVPRISKDGIKHEITPFLEAELYTLEESLEAEFQDFKNVGTKKVELETGLAKMRQKLILGDNDKPTSPVTKVN